jgi:hypothetical protein
MTTPEPNQNRTPPRLEFLRKLLPSGTPEAVIREEEARFIAYAGIIERIVLQNEAAGKGTQGIERDSTQIDSDSIV